MATNNINIGINVSSNGTLPKATSEAKTLNTELDKAVATAAKLGTQRPASQTAAVAASARARPAASMAAEPYAESRDYGRARGAAGTGAGARDFAKQSEGLGGLVRLYATVAANVFAATAAFSALSRAMDTTNMVKGLDQLGATSGQSLGSLSKRIFELTDRSVSLREAMEATVKATSSGMGGKDLERLAIGAKKASQALGVDMSDALSRLTRGITKLEPELLDELGIFVRVDDAAAKYAKTLGVSASSLTDVQRRAAFAAETLAQVESKFGAINIEANPFTKLAASLANLAQAGLEIVNKFLGPLAKLLAENTGLLAAVVGGIGVKLLGTAVPAISAWRESMQEAADAAVDTAATLENAFKEGFQPRWEQKLAIPALKTAIDTVDKELIALGKKAAGGLTGASADKAKLDPSTINRANLTKQINEQKLSLAFLESLEDEASKKAAKNLTKEIDLNEQLRAKLEQRKDLVQDLAKRNDVIQNEADKTNARFYSTQVIAEKKLDEAKRNSTKLSSLASVAENTRIDGIRGALKQLDADLLAGGVKGWDSWGTKAKGALVSVGTRVAGIIESLSGFGEIAAAAFAVFQTLDAIFSTNKEAAAKFETAVEASNDAVAALDRTLEAIAKKPLDQVLSVESLKARTTSIKELAAQAQELVSTLTLTDETSSGWDKFFDGFLSVADKGLKGIASKNLAINIAKQLQGMPEGEIKTELQEKLGSILNTTKFDFTSLNTALNSISEEGYVGAITQVAAATGKSTIELDKVLSPLQAMEASVNKAGTTFGELAISLSASSDPITKFGIDLLDAGNTMAKAFESPATALTILNGIIKNTNQLSLLSPSSRTELLAASKDLKALATEAGDYEKQLNFLNKQLAESKDKSVPLQQKQDKGTLSGAKFAELETAKANEARIEASIAEVRASTKVLEERTKSATAILKTLSVEVINSGLRLIGRELDIATAKAAIGVTRSIISTMQGVGRATIDASLKTRELDLQIQQVSLAQSMLVEQAATRLASEKTATLLEGEKLGNTARQEIVDTGSISPETQKQLIQFGININDINDALDYISKTASINTKSLAASDKSAGAKQRLTSLAIAGNKSAGEMRGIAGDKESIKIEKQAAERQAQEAAEVRSIQAANTLKALETDKLRLMIAGSEVIDSTLLARIQEAEKTAVVAANTDKIRAAQFAIEQQVTVVTDLKTKNETPEIQAAAAANLKERLIQLIDAVAEGEARVTAEIIRQNIVSLTNDQAKAKREQTLRDEQTRYNTEYESAAMDLRQKELDALISVGGLSKAQAVERKTDLELEAFALEQKNALINKNIETQDKLKAIQDSAAKQKLASPGADTAGIDAQAASAAAAVNTSAQQYIDNLIRINELKKEGIVLLSKEQKEMAKIEDLAETLAKAFGDVGTKLGGGLTAILKATQKTNAKRLDLEKTSAKKRKAIEDDVNGDYFKKQDRLAEFDQQTAKDRTMLDIESYGEMAGAAKGMFAEKTFAYRAFAAFEKAMSVIKLATLAAEIAGELGLTTVSVAASGTRSAAKGTESIVNAMKDLPTPFNFIAGAAMAAIIASLLGGGGGGSVSIPGGISAKDRQETQGTGMSWVNGKKVENGGGVFGDSEAKVDVIKGSLERISENTVDGLAYDNKVVNLLTSIDQSIGGAAKDLYGIKGLRVGSAFNTKEGTNSSGGLQGLLGSKRSTRINDSGLVFSGSFRQLTGEISGGIAQLYEDVTNTKKSWYGKTKSRDVRNVEDSDEAMAFINATFSDATSLFMELGDQLGFTSGKVETLLDGLGTINFEASLRGLKGDELQAELSSVIGNQLGLAADTVFSRIVAEFEEFGEDAASTVIRVLDESSKVAQVLRNSGMGEINVAKTETYRTRGFLGTGIGSKTITRDRSQEDIKFDTLKITDNLVNLAGGIETFVERSQSYSENFLTEAARLAPVQEAVTDEMNRLGYSSVDTREEFAALVSSLDVSIPTQAELYTNLMRVNEGFAMVTPALKETMSAEDIRVKKLELSANILELEGRATEALAQARADELAELDSSLHGLQKYIYALEDATRILELETDLVSTLGFSYKAVLISREMELRALTDSEKAIKRQIYLAEDRASTNKLLINLLEAEGKSAEALVYTRKLELAALSDGDAAIQRRIYFLQDEAALKDKLRTAYDKESGAIKTVIDSTKSAIKTLNDYKLSLAGGDKSVLTPAQKYQQAKDEATRVAAIATGIATTEAEKTAQLDAIQKLPGVSDAFLAASRTMYASSEAYTTDYNLITGILETASATVETQKSTAEQQLETLNSSVGFLDLIQTNTETTAELLGQYINLLSSNTTTGISAAGILNTNLTTASNSAQYYGGTALSEARSPSFNMPVAGYASGGLASGISLVGEQGPELVNFANPGMVTPAGSTSTIFNNMNNTLVAELRQLRREVSQLRAEQKEQTGHLITTNYDANMKAATKVSQGAEEMQNTAEWKNRSAVAIR